MGDVDTAPAPAASASASTPYSTSAASASSALGRGHTAAIVVVALLSHGLWLFNDGVFYDAWLEWAAGTYGKWKMLQGWFDDSGMPQVGWVHQVLMRSPSPQLTYALVGFGCWTLLGVLVARIAKGFGARDADATIAGCLVVASRVAVVGVSFIHAPYFMSLTALAGLCVVLVAEARAPVALSWRPLVRQRVVVYVLIFFASMMPSSLAACYAIGALVVVVDVLHGRRMMALIKRIDLMLIPALIFWWQRMFFPAQGGFSGHNKIKLGRQFERVLDTTVEAIFVDASAKALAAPVAVLVVGALCAAALASRGKASADVRRAAGTLAFALLWLVPAVFPYVVVNKAASMQRLFTWRHGMLILFLVPLAYVLVAYVVRRFRPLRLLWAGVAGVAIAGQGFSAAAIHTEWLGAAAKQRAIELQGRAAALSPTPEMVWVDDRVAYPANVRTISYELTGLVSRALGTLYAGALSLGSKSKVESFRIGYFWYYLLPGFRGDGPHAVLTVQPREQKPPTLSRIGLCYAAARLGCRGAAYANEMFVVSLTPTEPPPDWSAKVKEARQAEKARKRRERREARAHARADDE